MAKLILASGSAGRKSLLQSLKIPFEIVESTVDEEKIQDSDPVKLATMRAIAKTESVAEKLLLDFRGLGRGDSHGTDYADKNQSVKSVPRKSTGLICENPDDERRGRDDVLIIGADTVGYQGKWVFGKPKSRGEAEEMLKRLSGKTHSYVSAHTIIKFETRNSKLETNSKHKNINLIKTEDFVFNLRNSNLKNCFGFRASDFEFITGYDISSVTFRKISDLDIKTYLDRVEFLKLCGAFKIMNSPQDFVVKTEGSISNIIGLSLEKVIPILRKNFLLD